jgi:hypothetical protein
VQNRIWTSERRFRHGLQDEEDPYAVCLQEPDTANHILLQCVTAREVWHICRQWLELDIEEPGRHDTLEAWWTRLRARIRGKEKRDFDGLVYTACYTLWKNRNRWVFNEVHQQHSAISLAVLVSEEYNLLEVLGRQEATGGTLPHAARE